MLRFRGRRLQEAAHLDPPWLGLPRWLGRSPPCALSPSGGSAQKAACFLSPPWSGRSLAPPRSSYLVPSASSGAIVRPSPSTFLPNPSPSTCLPLPSPLEKPARSRVGTAKLFRPPPAFCSSTGAGLPLPSPQASTPPGVMLLPRNTCPCPSFPSPSTCVPVPLPSTLERPAGSRVGMSKWPKPFLPAPALPSWTSAASRSPICRGIMLYPPRAALFQLKSRLPRNRLFSKSFGTNSAPPAKSKKIVEFSPLSPHLAPASVQSHKIRVYKKLKEFEFGFMKPDHIRATIADDLEVVNSQFDLDYLMRLCDEKIKDILVASGIYIDPSDETYLAALDAGLLSAWENVFDQKGPLYLTTLDVMRKLVALPPFKWRRFLDYLRDSKILVIERWDLSLGNIETMLYSHRIKYPVGCKTIYRGQTDASFKKTLNKASLCGIIWKDTQVFDCIICPMIACKSNIEAEILSAVMLLRRVIDLKIEDFMLHTDCSHVDGVLREEMVVKADSEHEDLSRLLVGLKARFGNIFCQLEPREKLFFPDCLLRLERATILVFEEILRIWSPHLLGLPIFRIHQKRRKIEKKLISKQASGGKLILHGAYKVKVKDETSKLDGMRDVVMGMRPSNVQVLVKTKKEAILVKQELKKLFTKGTLVEFEKRKKILGKGYEVAVMKQTSATREETLRVIFHSSMEDVTAQRIPNTMTVKLLTPEDSDDNIEALRPECFLFFNGKSGVLLDNEKKS